MKITKLNELPELPVSHDPQLKKKLLIANGVIPHLTGFSQAVIPQNGTVTSHHHEDMTEVFFVSGGEGIVTVNAIQYPLTEGTCIVVEPKEEHSLKNTGSNNLILTYFGLV